MTLAQEIIVLKELGQRGESHHLPGLELVPHVHGELLRLLRGIVHHGPGIQPARVQPTDLLRRIRILDTPGSIKYWSNSDNFFP